MRLALMGKHERLPAERAYDLGLVTEVVPHDALMDRAWEIAEVVNRNAPLAVRGTRLAIRKGAVAAHRTRPNSSPRTTA